jgi:hypothetical protein
MLMDFGFDSLLIVIFIIRGVFECVMVDCNSNFFLTFAIFAISYLVMTILFMAAFYLIFLGYSTPVFYRNVVTTQFYNRLYFLHLHHLHRLILHDYTFHNNLLILILHSISRLIFRVNLIV